MLSTQLWWIIDNVLIVIKGVVINDSSQIGDMNERARLLVKRSFKSFSQFSL